MFCVTSNCHNSVISKDFLVLFSTTCNLAKGEYFYGKISKINFLALGLFSRGVAQLFWVAGSVVHTVFFDSCAQSYFFFFFHEERSLQCPNVFSEQYRRNRKFSEQTVLNPQNDAQTQFLSEHSLSFSLDVQQPSWSLFLALNFSPFWIPAEKHRAHALISSLALRGEWCLVVDRAGVQKANRTYFRVSDVWLPDTTHRNVRASATFDSHPWADRPTHLSQKTKHVKLV